VFERVSGPEHPDTLTARDNLAYWTGRAERDPGTGVLLRRRAQFYVRDVGHLSEVTGRYL
jgi:hypothetical protein